jgi:hypothetical protein
MTIIYLFEKICLVGFHCGSKVSGTLLFPAKFVLIFVLSIRHAIHWKKCCKKSFIFKWLIFDVSIHKYFTTSISSHFDTKVEIRFNSGLQFRNFWDCWKGYNVCCTTFSRPFIGRASYVQKASKSIVFFC